MIFQISRFNSGILSDRTLLFQLLEILSMFKLVFPTLTWIIGSCFFQPFKCLINW